MAEQVDEALTVGKPHRSAAGLLCMDFTTAIGLLAAICTTVSYFPQLKKCWQTGETGDLSLTMFATLATGIALWIVYGVLKADAVIILANAVSFLLLLGILYFKVRERLGAT
jgi:MtN3 and saliva related transmembrane protein